MPKSVYNDPQHIQSATLQVLRRELEEKSNLRIENQRLFTYAQQLEAEIAATEADNAEPDTADPIIEDEEKSASKKMVH